MCTCTQLHLYVNLITVLKGSSRVGSGVVRNLRTVVVYHILHGLLPQLGAASSDAPGTHDAGAGLSKLLGHIRFSVPLVEWTHQALEDLNVLCVDLAHEGGDDAQVHVHVVIRDGLAKYM